MSNHDFIHEFVYLLFSTSALLKIFSPYIRTRNPNMLKGTYTP